MDYQISAGQPIAVAISSDEELNYLNKQDSDEWDSDSSDEEIQDPENPSTKFNEQAVTLNSDEFTEKIDEIEKPLLIKLGRAKLEIITKIKYQLEFEEYPETSENGVACVYNVAGMDTEKVLEIFDLKNIQYAYKDGTTCKSVYCPFLNTKVYKETRTCCGIKICQFAASELVTMTHISVNFDDHLFKKIFEAIELSLDMNTLK
ncbi:6335_t:CDS:2 [Gigaspora rosea]|nr:6335_t:CDS:2 [Gigaspora rosea]